MTREKNIAFFTTAIDSLQSRLKENQTWYPFPAFLSCGLVLILIGHLIPGLNPRLGNRANLIKLKAERAPEGTIFLAVYDDNGKNIVVTTSDRRLFSWGFEPTERDLKDFRLFLKDKRKKDLKAQGLAHRYSEVKSTVVLAVDHHLKYRHITPIISELAAQGFHRYGFETLMTDEAENSNYQE